MVVRVREWWGEPASRGRGVMNRAGAQHGRMLCHADHPHQVTQQHCHQHQLNITSGKFSFCHMMCVLMFQFTPCQQNIFLYKIQSISWSAISQTCLTIVLGTAGGWAGSVCCFWCSSSLSPPLSPPTPTPPPLPQHRQDSTTQSRPGCTGGLPTSMKIRHSPKLTILYWKAELIITAFMNPHS